ncbi:hypothetical protein K3495_g16035 [Podosphaera aphanis]|nr:hypothetical protein K3495_g16035 [Podosphaera aphanis]
MDWNLFGYDNSRAFLMIYNSLKGGALEKAGPFYEAGGINKTRDPEDFIEFLDRLYLDSTRVSQANLDLHSMKMKETERWADFLAAWSNKLTEARGDFWPDENKISMLQNAMNKKLTRALIGNHLLPDDDFNEWTQIVNKVAQQVERAEKKAGWLPSRVEFESGEQSSGPRREVFRNDVSRESDRINGSKVSVEMEQPAVDSSGDTVMGGVNSTRIPGKIQGRARWKSRAQLDRLKEEGKCFRCERKGCLSRSCPLLPAQRPRGTGPGVNMADLPEIDPSVFIPLNNTEVQLDVPEN